MLYEAQFRNPAGAGKLIQAIRDMDLPELWIMEICGTHTMSIAKAGLRQILPPHIHLISGPGCPVCVTPSGVMDEVLRISQLPNVTITTYGDLLRVPGSVPGDNLQRRSAQGADVRMVYSPMDSLDMAEQEPDREFIFLGVGFETTAPGTAIAVQEAKARGRKNFSLLSLLKRTEPAMRAIIESDDFNVSGFLCPGHVATILGEEGFRFLAEEYGIPSVIAGFETGDILAAVYQLLRQIQRSRGVSVLMNSHNLELSLEFSDHIIGISRGQVIFDGAPDGQPPPGERVHPGGSAPGEPHGAADHGRDLYLAGRCVAWVGHHPQQRLRPAAGIFRLRCGSEVRLPAGGQGGENRM